MSAGAGRTGKAGGGGKRRRHVAHEEHENHERWLVTYADMLTLLMVLFIVMFAMSAVDQRKFQALADGLAEGFGAPSVAFKGKPEPLDGDAKKSVTAMTGAAPSLQDGVANPSQADGAARDAEADKRAVAAADRLKVAAAANSAEREVKNLREVQERITKALRAKKMEDAVRFSITERGLVVTIVTSEVVFAGDRADLLAGGRTVLDAIAPTLVDLPNTIQVDGHTNQLPVPTVNYPSAWELSTARASTVVRFLHDHGVPERRLSAAGYAGTRPLYPPDDPRAPKLNRRVDVVVLSNLDPAAKSLLPAAAGEDTHATPSTDTHTTTDNHTN
jgi:chemotaxis protein MotB